MESFLGEFPHLITKVYCIIMEWKSSRPPSRSETLFIAYLVRKNVFWGLHWKGGEDDSSLTCSFRSADFSNTPKLRVRTCTYGVLLRGQVFRPLTSLGCATIWWDYCSAGCFDYCTGTIGTKRLMVPPILHYKSSRIRYLQMCHHTKPSMWGRNYYHTCIWMTKFPCIWTPTTSRASRNPYVKCSQLWLSRQSFAVFHLKLFPLWIAASTHRQNLALPLNGQGYCFITEICEPNRPYHNHLSPRQLTTSAPTTRRTSEKSAICTPQNRPL